METLKFLKSFHTLSNLPIQVFDENFKSLYILKSDKTQLLEYNFNSNFNLIKFEDKLNKVNIINGFFNELYIFYPYKNIYILVGPFKYSKINKSLLSKKLSCINIKLEERKKIYRYLINLELFSLGDIDDILTHLNYCLSGNFSSPLSEDIHNYLNNFYLKLEESKISLITSKGIDTDIYLFYYEQKILQYVKNGDEFNLKEIILKLDNSPIPYPTGNELRSYKNYSITLFEKLANTAINVGIDIIEAYRCRDLFIAELELTKTINEILKIRSSAILYFTRLISNMEKHYSTLITNIIHYISINIYNSLKIKEIAKHFYISETCLRNKFKNETNMTIQEFITNKKIEESKLLLNSNFTITEIAIKLGFFDTSHFSKTFKNITGITPKQYQLLNKTMILK